MSDLLLPRVRDDIGIEIALCPSDVVALCRGEVPPDLQNQLIGLVIAMHETPAERVGRKKGMAA